MNTYGLVIRYVCNCVRLSICYVPIHAAANNSSVIGQGRFI